jgi:hypothetical protein
LQQILGLVGVAGLQVEARVHQARGAAHEFLERSPVAPLGALDQLFFGVEHKGVYREDDAA